MFLNVFIIDKNGHERPRCESESERGEEGSAEVLSGLERRQGNVSQRDGGEKKETGRGGRVE